MLRQARAADVDQRREGRARRFDSGPWPQTSAADRGRLLYKLAEKIRANAASLAELECRNSGKPIVEAEYDIADAATCFEYYAGLANKVIGHVNPVPANALSFTLREPVGVAGQIIPWNYPLVMACVETGSRHRRRVHLRPQARRADPAHHDGSRRLV